MFEFTEGNIVDLIGRNQSFFCTSYDVMIPNCYTQHDNEADLFAIRKSGICDEFEIKISRNDFFNDAKKIVNYREIQSFNLHNQTDDHIWLDNNRIEFHKKKIIAPWQKLKYQALVDGDMPTNYFWYVVKSGIVSAEEIPEWAGVVFVNNDGELNRVRQPQKLHKEKLSFEQRYLLTRKLGYRFWDYRLGNR